MTWPPKRSQFAVDFGQLLHEARIAAGMSQSQVGESVGVIQAMVSRYERGVAQPDAERLVRLVRLLNIDFDSLEVAS